MKDGKKPANADAKQVVRSSGGMFGNAGRALMGRKAQIDEAEEKASGKSAYADGGMVKKKAGSGHSKIAAAHRDKPFMPK